MRRVIVLVIAGLALLASVAACGDGEEAPTLPGAGTTQPTATEPIGGRTPDATPGTQLSPTAPGGVAGHPAQGRQVAQTQGCLACHTIDGTASVGPSWRGIWGSQRQLASGQTVTADAGYVRESITRPDAKVVQGFQPGVMPQNYEQQLTDQQLQDLIAYIESLR